MHNKISHMLRNVIIKNYGSLFCEGARDLYICTHPINVHEIYGQHVN